MGAVKGMLMDDAENILNVTAEKLIGGDIFRLRVDRV